MLMAIQDLLAILVIKFIVVTLFIVLFTLANFTEPTISNTVTTTIASTTKESNIEAIVGVTVGVGTIFLILVVIAIGLVCYFRRLNKKITETTATLNPIELNDEKISPSKTETIQPLNKDVEIESSS